MTIHLLAGVTARIAGRSEIVSVALGALLLTGKSASAQITQGLDLDGVTIVDAHDGKLTPNMVIVIDGGIYH